MIFRKKKKAYQLKYAKIMVVDDEKDLNQLLCTYLNNQGFKTISAYNGQEALDLLKAEMPGLILLDVMMPGIDGLEVLRRIRENNKYTKIIMLTALEDKDVIKKASELGADDYIPKPYSFEQIKHTLLSRMAKL